VLVGPAASQQILDRTANRSNLLDGDLGIAIVDHEHPERTGRWPGSAIYSLTLRIAVADKAPLIDLVGDEVAHRRMHPPRLGKEDAAIGRYGGMLAEHPFQA